MPDSYGLSRKVPRNAVISGREAVKGPTGFGTFLEAPPIITDLRSDELRVLSKTAAQLLGSAWVHDFAVAEFFPQASLARLS